MNLLENSSTAAGGGATPHHNEDVMSHRRRQGQVLWGANHKLIVVVLAYILVVYLASTTVVAAPANCASLLTQADCDKATDSCAYDHVQTKRCQPIQPSRCPLYKKQASCQTNPACRWDLNATPGKAWFGTCVGFGKDDADPIMIYPKQPTTCESLKTKTSCLKFSGCAASTVKGKSAKKAKMQCSTMATLLRLSFQFLDGCSQNYGQKPCFDSTTLPYAKSFMTALNSSWYFVDRLEMKAAKNITTDGEIDSKVDAARVRVWYGHDSVLGRSFVYDIKTKPSISVLRYEFISDSYRICRSQTPLSPAGPFIATLEELLIKAPWAVLPPLAAAGTEAGFNGSSISGVFMVNMLDDTGASGSTTGTGPRHIINATSSNFVADVDQIWNKKMFFDTTINCDQTSDMQLGEFPPLASRAKLELPNVDSGGSTTPDITDTCFKACLLLSTPEAKQKCVLACSETANRKILQEQKAEKNATSAQRLAANQLSWEPLPDIRKSITNQFNAQVQSVMDTVNNNYLGICKTTPSLSSSKALVDNARNLANALDGLDSGLARPVELSLAKVFNVVSLVQRISDLVTALDKQLGDVALILKLLSAIPAISGTVAPVYNAFNNVRSQLVTSVQSKLKSIASALGSFKTPVINILQINEEVRKMLNMVSAAVRTFVVNPVDVAKCVGPVDSVAGNINPLMQTARNAVQTANDGLGFLKTLVQKVNSLLSAVSESAVKTVLDGITQIKSFWDNTVGKIIYPLSKALDKVVSFSIPWLCKSTKRVCADVPCGVNTCQHEVWCGASCNWKGCKSKYCKVDYPCGVKMCYRCTDVDFWYPCLKPVRYTVREILTGVANLLGGALDAAMAAVKPVLDSIPKLSLGMPAIPGLSSIPTNLDQLKSQIGDQIANEAKSKMQSFAYSQMPSQLRCGLTSYINQGTLISLFTCPPFDAMRIALLGQGGTPTTTLRPVFNPPAVTRSPSIPTRTPTRTPITPSCPSPNPLLCSGASFEYCCSAFQGSNSVCCNSINSCVCPGTGDCPYKNQCCSASFPVMCSGSNGNEICCEKGPNGETNVCCSATNSCGLEFRCCTPTAPNFCRNSRTNQLYCCPSRPDGSSAICCSASGTCTTTGSCPAARAGMSKTQSTFLDKVLGEDSLVATAPETTLPAGSAKHKGVRMVEKDFGLTGLIGGESKSKGIGLAGLNAPLGEVDVGL